MACKLDLAECSLTDGLAEDILAYFTLVRQ